MSTVDRQGRMVGLPKVVWLPEPDHVGEKGIGQLHTYVARLMTSQARFTSLIAFTPDQQRGILLRSNGGQVTLGIHVDWRREPQKEQAIRALFSELKVQPSQDYLAGNGSVPDATRILDYPLSGNSTRVTEVCKRVLREVYGVTDEEALEYTYEEHP